MTLIDSTFSTPINCRPVEFGIDLVMHSGTKYFGGHSDVICGIVAGRRDLIKTIHATRTTLGCNMDPHAAWLLCGHQDAGCACAAPERECIAGGAISEGSL